MKPLVLTPRAARWLHLLVHSPNIAVPIGANTEDLQAATEAVRALDSYIAKLGPVPPPPPAVPPNSPAAAGKRGTRK